MDGGRMPEIMQTRLIASAAVPLDAGNLTQATECFGNYRIFQGRAVLLAEQQVFAVSRMPAAVLRDECLQHRAQAGADRDDARLEELRPFDVEQRSRKIDVLDFETTGLPATQSGTIQEQYERPQRVCVDPGTSAGRRWHPCQNALQLGFGVDVV
jgi:hypothetical protein